MEQKSLTGVRKRQQITNANKQMMIWVGSAAAVVTICAMVSFNLVQHIMYQAKVIGEKSTTEKTIKDSISAVGGLKNNVNALQTNSNLLALRADPNDTAFNVVIDALPTEDDSTALGSSLQNKILVNSGVVLSTFTPSASTNTATATTATGSNGTAKTASLSAPAAQPIQFTFNIDGNYDAIQQALKDIERTIRPIIISSIKIQGSDNKLKAMLTATTYYAPKASYSLGSKKVIPDGQTDPSTTKPAGTGTSSTQKTGGSK